MNPKFHCVDNPPDDLGVDGDACVDRWGWRRTKLRGRWHVTGKLPAEGGHMLFHSGEQPRHVDGRNGDFSVSPDGEGWKKRADKWEYSGWIAPQPVKDVRVSGLRVDGNVSLPLVNGKIPVFDGNGVYVGYLTPTKGPIPPPSDDE